MPSYKVLLLNAQDGEVIAELPASGLSVTKVLTGLGTCSFKVAAFSGKASRQLLSPVAAGGREIAVVRNNTTCVFNGPLIRTQRDVEGNCEVTAADCSYYLSRRVTEAARAFNRPVLAIVSNLFDMALFRISPISTNSPPKPAANLYRMDNEPRDGGPVKRFTIGSTDRIPILEVLGDLADDTVGGFDWRWQYDWQPAGMQVSRRFQIGQPTHGVDRPDAIVETPALIAFSDTESLERAGTRVHVLGAGTGSGQRRAVVSNNAAHAAGRFLLETVIDRTNVDDVAVLTKMAQQYVNLPERILETTIRYQDNQFSAGIRFGEVLLGDTVRIRVNNGVEVIDIKRRVVAETLQIADDGAETAAWTYNQPLDEYV